MELQSIRRMGKAIIIIMMTILISPLIMGSTMKIYPSDDAFVRDSSPNENFGTGNWKTNLRIGYEPSHGIDKSYLKFDLSGLQGETINSAVFSIERLGSHDNPNVDLYYVSDNAWEEGTITWNNAPSTSTLIDSTALSGQEDRIEFNIDGSYLEPSEFSFALIEDGGSGFVNSFSKDLDTGGGDEVFWPYLEIDYEESGTECNTDADVNCDGCVDLLEMVNLMLKYKQGETDLTLLKMVNIMLRYKQGEISC